MMKQKIRQVRDLWTVHFGLQTQNEQGCILLASGGTSKLIPRKPIIGTCSVAQNGFHFENIQSGETPSSPSCSFGVINGLLQPGDCRTKSCLNNFYIQIKQKDDLLKTGDATSIYTIIQTTPNVATTINTLTQLSPYLSDGVLTAILNSTMSGTNIRNILAANMPLSPYIKALAQQKLSATQFNYLNNLQQLGMVSLRDNAIAERTILNNQKMSLLHFLTDSLVQVGNFVDADNLFAADTERFSREARIGLKLQNANYVEASQLLSEYPTTTQEDADFKFIQTLNLNRINSLGKPKPLDSIALFEIALGYTPQSGYAKTLASVIYGTSFVPVIPPLPTSSGFEQSNGDRNTQIEEPVSFTVFPNPANETIIVDIPSGQNLERAEILIFDLNGKLLHSQEVFTTTTLIDISQLSAGFYAISWSSGGKIKASKYFVKTKI
jgi:Secretion system C-terminal sorting domain